MISNVRTRRFTPRLKPRSHIVDIPNERPLSFALDQYGWPKLPRDQEAREVHSRSRTRDSETIFSPKSSVTPVSLVQFNPNTTFEGDMLSPCEPGNMRVPLVQSPFLPLISGQSILDSCHVDPSPILCQDFSDVSSDELRDILQDRAISQTPSAWSLGSVNLDTPQRGVSTYSAPLLGDDNYEDFICQYQSLSQYQRKSFVSSMVYTPIRGTSYCKECRESEKKWMRFHTPDDLAQHLHGKHKVWKMYIVVDITAIGNSFEDCEHCTSGALYSSLEEAEKHLMGHVNVLRSLLSDDVYQHILTSRDLATSLNYSTEISKRCKKCLYSWIAEVYAERECDDTPVLILKNAYGHRLPLPAFLRIQGLRKREEHISRLRSISLYKEHR